MIETASFPLCLFFSFFGPAAALINICITASAHGDEVALYKMVHQTKQITHALKNVYILIAHTREPVAG